MAEKKKGEKSNGRKAMEAAKKAMADAKTDAQKHAAQKAIDEAEKALAHEKAETFKRLASKRVSKALSAIGGVGKLANARAYRFDADQVAKIEKALTEASAEVARRYKSALGGKGPETAGGFSL